MENMKTVDQLRTELKSYVYSDSGRAINSRFKREYLISNGYSEHLAHIDGSVAPLFPSMSYSEHLRIFCKDMVYQPVCKQCGKEHLIWKRDGWATYCSQRCSMDDPVYKAKMSAAMKKVDWDSNIRKRKATMQERYGVEHSSDMIGMKERLSDAGKLVWNTTEKKQIASNKRKVTNLEKYGVEYVTQNKDIAILAGNGISKSFHSKTPDEKLTRANKFRKSFMDTDTYEKLSDVDYMRKLYIDEGKTLAQIGYIINTKPETVRYALVLLGFDIDDEREKKLVSALELDLFDYVKSLCPDTIGSYRIGKELDIFIPPKNIGIEFNGVYWHSDKHVGKDYHRQKLEHFNSHGIRVIQIWENDWNDNNQVVKAFLKNIIVPKKYIGARKTGVVELSQEEFNVFMDSLHMQGSVACPIRYGLMHEGVLVAAMGFKTIPRNTVGSEDGYDLVRFANTNVYGGFSKILKHFEKTHGPKLVKSFADLEIVDSVNNVYASNGFTAVETIPPDYRYYNRKTGNREHKFGWRKSKFSSLGLDITDKTEFMLADEYGLIRLWDSGKIRYEKSYQNALQIE